MYLCSFKAKAQVPEIFPLYPDSVLFYESQVSFKKNSFGGLFIVKPEEEAVRVSLTSKFGFKIFDFRLFKDSLETIYIVETLDKKIIKKVLYRDFQMLYPKLLNIKSIKTQDNQIKIKSKTGKYRYFVTQEEVLFVKKNLGLTNLKAIKNEEHDKTILIKHKFIGLSIEIKTLNLPNE